MPEVIQPSSAPRSALDAEAIRNAYRRWAGVYDVVFGGVSALGRRQAVAEVNRLDGARVLEVGVGTGLALPHYAPGKRITGIDLSADMLRHARRRVATERLRNVEALLELDAEETGFPDGSFDIAVAMFVVSVVPHPRRLLAEMRRVVRPDGHIVLINHSASERGARWWVERAMAPASRALGWHPDFRFSAVMPEAELASAAVRPQWPFGLFTLVRLRNKPAGLGLDLDGPVE
ncbi:MAG: class I SAM-dependent methyltransferase [Acidisphaera sp.]|nr:class I SAM-dependent methyltransferase [Acidisphaera sp.]MBV9813698.1 class I SAM-dependent methyltransferase [Acetobacteraceae bacterium]